MAGKAGRAQGRDLCVTNRTKAIFDLSVTGNTGEVRLHTCPRFVPRSSLPAEQNDAGESESPVHI